MSKARIVWANDADGIARHILEVAPGLECNCTCVGCHAKLEAVNSRNPNWKRRPHFRHHDAPELDDCAQSAVLAAARKSIEGLTRIRLPEHQVTRQLESPDDQVFVASAIEPEKLVDVDAVAFVDTTEAILTLSGGQQILVRLVASTVRTLEPKQTILGEIVIDVSDPVLRSADAETMRKHISLAPGARRWCHHYNEAMLIQAAQKMARDKLNDYLANRMAELGLADGLSSSEPDTSYSGQPVETRTSPTTRNHKNGRSATFIWTPVERHYGDPVGAYVPRMVKAAHRYKQLWQNWDWDAIMAFGDSCRVQGIALEEALTAARRKFRFSETNNIVRDAWCLGGIVRRLEVPNFSE